MKQVGFFLTIAILSALLFSCENSNDSNNQESESGYIAMHSTGVPVKSPVLVRLEEHAVLKEDMNEEAIARNIKITPSVAFSVEIPASNTIKIIPQQPLDNATEYKVEIRTDRILTGCTKKKYTFRFSTPQPVFSEYSNLTADADTDNLFSIKGNISTSDYVNAEFIENRFSVSPGNRQVTWEHSADGKEHHYTIADIKAGEGKITLTANYSPLCKTGKITREFVIPSEDSFQVMKIVSQNDPQKIEITFSSVIRKEQPVKNFIALNGKRNYKYVTDKNKITLYPSNVLSGKYELTIDKEIKNKKGIALENDFTQPILFGDLSPSVAFLNKGNILPSGNNNTLLFKSVNYAKVRVRIKQIYRSNLLQFLQENDLDDYYNLYNMSRIIADTTIVLGDRDSDRLKSTNNFGLNLDEIVKIQPGAIYRVEIRGVEPMATEKEAYDSDYYFGDWETYRDRSKNIVATDLALIVKQGGLGNYTVYAVNIMSGQPESNVKIKAYDRVNQELASAVTGSDGKAELTVGEPASTLFATKGEERSFIKISENNALQISNFDVGGIRSNDASVKAYLFGERGVWRPGDTVHVCAILLFEGMAIPEKYPVVAELYNPKGQLIGSQVKNNSTGIFHYPFATSLNDPTGRWEVKIKAGNEVFTKSIKIETVKPNKLKMALDFKDEILNPGDISGELKVDWLFGAPGKNLECTVNADISPAKTAFDNYPEYRFEDITNLFSRNQYEVAKGKTNQNGVYRMPEKMDIDFSRAPGFVQALFTVKAYEPSGDFSSSAFRKTISPFPAYVGLNVRETKGDWGDKYIDLAQPGPIRVAAVTAEGKPAPVNLLQVEIYKVSYRWWWSAHDNGGLASYAQDSQTILVDRFAVALSAGKGSVDYSWKENGYGCYLIKVTDPKGGHSSAGLYMVSSSSYGNPAAADESGSTRLAASLDKNVYQAGETALLTIPSAKGARALVSIEKGNRILNSFWIECEAGKTAVRIPVEGNMLPNAYVFITLIQPHSQTANDAPIRMYGIQRINVTDPASVLEPVISAPQSTEPQSKMNIIVSEKKGMPMSYVLMVVDEGLLGLTNFKTPDPWSYLYAKEALGVRTWDMYDKVIGAYGGRIEQLFAIGGDDELTKTLAPGEGAMRFKAVSKVLGPFSLSAKKSRTHTIEIPQYIGSLRIMAVATDGRAQGNTQKEVTVKKPVMVQATLPRVVATSEQITVPVTLFALEKNIGKVTVTIQTNNKFAITGEQSFTVDCNDTGEQLVNFQLQTATETGIGEVSVTAKSKSGTSTDQIEIDVVNPNPLITLSQSVILKGGESKNIDLILAGEAGSNSVAAEISSAPPVNLSYRLKYLIDYPYGCIEQITSSAFAQLGIYGILENGNPLKKQAELNIGSALRQLPSYAIGDGSLAYWPGSNQPSLWGTVYATHFVIRAQQEGYFIPGGLKESLIRYLKNTVGKRDKSYESVLPYALYVLALNGDAQRGIMNRLKENIGTMPVESQWLLAGAYALDGKTGTAAEVLSHISGTTRESRYTPFSATFESRERTQALALNTYNLLNKILSTSTTQTQEATQYGADAFRLAGILSGYLNDSKHYMSTQSTAWSLIAMGDFIKQQGNKGIDLFIRASDSQYSVKGNNPVLSQEISLKKAEIKQMASGSILPIILQNKGEGTVYCNLTATGIPAKEQEKEYANGLKMNITYYDHNNTPISVENLSQGTDFQSVVTITNTSATTDYTNLALNQRFASGWEIENGRINENGQHQSGVDYQDIRDDRVCSFFNLPQGKSISIKTSLKATYKGKFYLPAVSCEAMYDAGTGASGKGMWVTVK